MIPDRLARRRGFPVKGIGILAGLVLVPAGNSTEVPGSGAVPAGVFDLPELADFFAGLERDAGLALQRRDYGAAGSGLEKLLRLAPGDPVLYSHLAKVRALQGRREEVWPNLRRAVELGWRDAAAIRADRDLALLQAEPEFNRILREAEQTMALPVTPAVPPARVEEGRARVEAGNTTWDFRLGMFRSFFDFSASQSASLPVMTGREEVADQLRGWFAEGTAAGNAGDLYDNRDGGHSPMDLTVFPQFARLTYGGTVVAKGWAQGPQLRFLYNAVTLGNSSTAVTGTGNWRSLTRLACTSRGGPALLYAQYRGNQLYVYPEHRDHDPDHRGDVFAANTPYLVTSQGSSGSDQPFLKALACTLAAFRPEVKTGLARGGLLMPTLQMILRRTYRGGPGHSAPGDFFGGDAHPAVFDAAGLDGDAMVRMAHDLVPGEFPPLVQVRVVEESRLLPGLDDGAGGPEQLFDTPCAIARVHRTLAFSRRMILSARGSFDAGGKPLTYRWSLLRGDPGRVSIQPLNPEASEVEVRIGWHERRPVREGSPLFSNRVDIGVFVSNGRQESAPGFITTYFPANVRRGYDEARRLLWADGTAEEEREAYTDPLIDGRRDWRDEFTYDSSGVCTGWSRRIGDRHDEFTAGGRLILKRGPGGEVLESAPVTYRARMRGEGEEARLEWSPETAGEGTR
jgi:hypothetical protein